MYIVYYTSMLIFSWGEGGLAHLFLTFKGALPLLVPTPVVQEQKVKSEIDTDSIVSIVFKKAWRDHPYCP